MRFQIHERWQAWLADQQALHALHLEIEPDRDCPCGICTPDETAHLADLQADIHVLATGEGGRRTPFLSGYRPQFYYDGYNSVLGQLAIVAPMTLVFPGVRTLILLDVACPEFDFGRLFPGKEFQFREGERIVARGRITMLLGLAGHARSAVSYPPNSTGLA